MSRCSASAADRYSPPLHEGVVIGSTTTPAPTPTASPSARELDDLETLLLGGYRPIGGFLGPADLAAVVAVSRLADGTPWPAPVTLVVPAGTAERAVTAGALDLLDEEGTAVARLAVRESWPVGPASSGLAGLVHALAPLERGSHRELRRSAGAPAADRPVLGVPLDRLPHAPHVAALLVTAGRLGARVLLLPLTGHGSPRGVDGPALVRACVAVAVEMEKELGTAVDVVPVAVPRHGDDARHRMVGASVAAAYGATHVPGPLPHDDPVAVELPAMAQDAGTGRWAPVDDVAAADRGPHAASEVDRVVRDLVRHGRLVPPGLTSDAVLREIVRTARPGGGVGATVLFTGLPGAGKSTIARAVSAALLDRTDRTVTLLDGDVVRRMLSSELTFSPEHRALNVRRIGYVASEITRHGGIALCAPIAPYAAGRAEVRSLVEDAGGFLLVHVATSLAVCESRDRKGHYAKARAGVIADFTGISAPYEEPADADVVIDTAAVPVDDAVRSVLDALTARGWLVG